ncbi:hypothetical protein [Burkholderia ubonensis]|uniref:hypothetical protein n=1 Tax=Burkholderia ubonensis TaxID=101571 RepID=UPI00075D1EC6|nr:hypothetical protein [Burkholderia ubonensis]KVG39011.1 hypothetical protein WJ31_11575 [Burkholderia ubonensis]
MGRPLVQHNVCIDLPGEPVSCWAETDITVLLRKHRDVIFDINLKKDSVYTIESDKDWFYDVGLKKRVQRGRFQDGERYHIWVGRDFKGSLLLKSNGRLVRSYSMLDFNLGGGSSDPKVKPEPIIFAIGGFQGVDQSASRASTGINNVFAHPAPLVCRNTDGGMPGTAWWGQMVPLNFGAAADSPDLMFPSSVPLTQQNVDEDLIVHIFEVSLAGAPAEVLRLAEEGGSPTALKIDEKEKVVTRNWLISQFAGGLAYVKDNWRDLSDLFNRKFVFMTIKHQKVGVKHYVAFKGNSRLRKIITETAYKLKSTKIMAITAGAAEGMAETAKASAKAWTGAFKGAGGIAFILTIGLDVAEWYHDYEQINPDGTRGKGLADLVAKVGIDVVAAGVSSILGAGVYYLLTTALTGFGVAVGGWVVGLVALVVIGVTAFFFYVIGVADNHYLYTKKAAGLARKAMRYLEKTYPKNYNGYPMIVTY